MQSLFSRRSHHGTPKAAGSRPGRPRRQQPGLEALEGRQLMSLGSEFLANTTTRNSQFESDNASAANGISVAVWTDAFSNTDHDIRAQMFNAQGFSLGSEIIVENSGADAVLPSVAMDATGNWVATWQQTVNGQKDIMARRFSSTGAPLGSAFAVANSTKNESDPDVARDASGNFVVSYTLQFSSTDLDIHARRFNSSGAFLQDISVATSGSEDATRSSVAMSSNGKFDVAYQSQLHGVAEEDILLNRYNAAGGLLGSNQVAFTTAREMAPSVSMDDFGNAVVAYQKFVGSDFDIKARRVSSTGVMSSEINIRNTLANETAPTVAMKRSGGSFVVAYNSTTSGVGRTVQVTEVNASNTIVAQHNLAGNNNGAALSIDAGGDYLLTYTGITGSNNDRNIHLRFGHLS